MPLPLKFWGMWHGSHLSSALPRSPTTATRPMIPSPTPSSQLHDQHDGINPKVSQDGKCAHISLQPRRISQHWFNYFPIWNTSVTLVPMSMLFVGPLLYIYIYIIILTYSVPVHVPACSHHIKEIDRYRTNLVAAGLLVGHGLQFSPLVRLTYLNMYLWIHKIALLWWRCNAL